MKARAEQPPVKSSDRDWRVSFLAGAGSFGWCDDTRHRGPGARLKQVERSTCFFSLCCAPLRKLVAVPVGDGARVLLTTLRCGGRTT